MTAAAPIPVWIGQLAIIAMLTAGLVGIVRDWFGDR
jgi:hypothetical protein